MNTNEITNILKEFANVADCWRYESESEGWGLVEVLLDSHGFEIKVLLNKDGGPNRTQSKHRIIAFAVAVNNPAFFKQNIMEQAQSMGLTVSSTLMNYYGLTIEAITGKTG